MRSDSARLLLIAIVGMLAAAPQASNAQVSSVWSAQFTIANDYRNYGVSQLVSGSALQAGVDYQHYTGFFAGLQMNNVDYVSDQFRDSRRDSQVDVYAGYSWNSPRWLVNTTLRRYRYPGSRIDYDYSELAVSAVYRNRYFASVDYTSQLLSRWTEAVAYEAGLAWPLPRGMELSASAGRFHSADFIEASYTHWNIGISKVYKRFSLDLRRHDDSLSRTTPLGNAQGTRWVLSASYAWQKRT